MLWHKFYSIFCFTLSKRSWVFGVLLVLIICAMSAVYGGLSMGDINNFWDNKLNTVFSFSTLLVALALWFWETHQDWVASLPCKLTAAFLFNRKEVMRCDEAELFSEADMRALGQQLGAQMNNGNNLKMKSPAILRSGGLLKVDVDGKIYRHWTIAFTLTELPDVVKNIPNDQFLLWSPPFDKVPELVLCNA